MSKEIKSSIIKVVLVLLLLPPLFLAWMAYVVWLFMLLDKLTANI